MKDKNSDPKSYMSTEPSGKLVKIVPTQSFSTEGLKWSFPKSAFEMNPN